MRVFPTPCTPRKGKLPGSWRGRLTIAPSITLSGMGGLNAARRQRFTAALLVWLGADPGDPQGGEGRQVREGCSVTRRGDPVIGSYHCSVTLSATAAAERYGIPFLVPTRWRSTPPSAASSGRSKPLEEGNLGPLTSLVVATTSSGRFPWSARDPTTALAKSDRSKAIAVARGAENDLVAVF
jgi:hypothetical protein